MCIPNLPSGAARTATLALTSATLPYLQAVADGGIDAALREYPELARGTYLYRGRCASESLARIFEVDWVPAGRRGGPMSWSEAYRRKVTSAEAAVRTVASGEHVWLHAGCNNPEELLNALVARAASCATSRSRTC